MSTTEHVLALLARLIAPHVAAELARQAQPAIYTTERRAEYPPGEYPDDDKKARRVARERIRRVPGHERIGEGRATVWRVERAKYHEHYARRRRPAEEPTPAADDDLEAMADRALEGWRSTRRAS